MEDARGARRIVVIGCGALGSVFAGLLANAGHSVTAACRRLQHRERIRAHGLVLREGAMDLHVPLEACPDSANALDEVFARPCDLVIILVKAFDTEHAAAALASRIAPGTPVLTLQNGLGNAEALAAHLKQHPIVAGATTFGAKSESAGVVRLTGRGECEIGAWNQLAEPALEPLAELLSSSGIPCSVSPDVRGVLWKKVAINAVINPLTAILRIPNGELLEHKEVFAAFREGIGEISHALIEEVHQVAEACGIALPSHADLLGEVRRVCRITAENRSSMLCDVELGQRTEIDAINGAVARLGRGNGVPTPVNSALAALVRASSCDSSAHREPSSAAAI